eukprot:bmy_02477T0
MSDLVKQCYGEAAPILSLANGKDENRGEARIIMPFVKTCLMVLPSVQTIWKSMTDVVIAPLCRSIGRSFSSVSLQLSHD